jgi:hypothetical protein
MTPDDSLEHELESFRPEPPSPALRRRIGGRLDRSWRLRFPVAIATAAAAAALIFVATRHRPPPGPISPSTPAEAADAPSVLVYERAFARSPADLEAMLDEQAVRSSRSIAPSPAAVLGILALKGS